MPFFYWYPLKTAQNRTAHRTAQRTQAFFSTQANGTQGSTQRKPLLVSRKTVSRSTSRSESLYFLANRASANSGANSKIVVTSLLVTSEMILSKLQLSSELSSKMLVDRSAVDSLVDRKMKATNK